MVVCGFTQCAKVDFDETFVLVIKPGTMRMVLTITANRNRPVIQLNVSNAFLHGH
jgi:hypothetical protein